MTGQDIAAEARAAAVGFEAVKIAVKQDKTGIVLTLSVHPLDMPPSIYTDWVGSRYQVAMVKLSDDGLPEKPRELIEGEKAVAAAGALCRNVRFQQWLWKRGIAFAASEMDAVIGLQDHLAIESRADLKNDRAARERFKALRDEFEASISNKFMEDKR